MHTVRPDRAILRIKMKSLKFKKTKQKKPLGSPPKESQGRGSFVTHSTTTKRHADVRSP